MADAKSTNTPVVPTAGSGGDKVAMLSINKDGTPDQHDPEIIGDKDFALEATKRQFAENAVSAVDAEKRTASTGAAEQLEQDPQIAELKAEHDKAAAAAEKSAEKVVGSLFKGE